MTSERTKIAVVGAGLVESTCAYSLAASGLVREIAVIDADHVRAKGEAMDIAHAVPFFAPVTVAAVRRPRRRGCDGNRRGRSTARG